MPKFNRRHLLQGLAAGTAFTTIFPAIPGFKRKAYAHAPEVAFPTIFIHLFGGLDPVLHWDAKTGITNRNVQAADVRETAGGIRWYQPVLGPLGAHMEDATLIRGINVSSAHPAGCGLLWAGEGNQGAAAGIVPWANYLSSDLIVTQRVPAPTLATFSTTNDAIRDFTTHSNGSPNPLATAQRVTDISSFSDSLDVLAGMPPVPAQQRVYSHSEAMDFRTYSPSVQKRIVEAFAAGNGQATELLSKPPPVLWPPAQTTVDAFNLTQADINNNVGQNNQRFNAHISMAFEAARLQMSHVVFVQSTEGSYDTHNNHDAGQRSRSDRYMPTIGRLLTALKNTESPVIAGVSMFETTHVVISSELSRGPNAQGGNDQNGNPFDGSGTPHNNWTQALCFGGNFKRGAAFSATDNSLRGQAADFQTGELGKGQIPNILNLHATILKANGVDPSGWTNAAPIDFVLKA